MLKLVLIAISSWLLIGLVFTENDCLVDSKTVPEHILSSCCNRGMYASAMYQECSYEPSGMAGIVTRDQDGACGKMFTDCCRSYRDTKSCASGLTYALNGSYCPFMAWSIAGAKERVQRACCESCLIGLKDQESGDKSKGDQGCTKTRRDFAVDMEWSSYEDCCKRRLSVAASLNTLAGGRELEESESEVIVHRTKSISLSGSAERLTESRATYRSGSESAGPVGQDKPCSQNNPCAHFCVDEFAFTPKHCACRKDYFLAEDGATCIRYSQREYHYRQRCLERYGGSRGEYRSDDTPTSPVHCNQGYAYSAHLRRCVDIDECAEGKGRRCYSDQSCVNLEGSFFCKDNALGTPAPSHHSRGDIGGGGTGARLEACGPGLAYSVDKGYCDDVNECDSGLHDCRSNQVCRNTHKSYTCECTSGYVKDTSGNCVDVDECSDTRYTLCPAQEAICFNTPGSYQCLCKDGFNNAKKSDGTTDMQSCVDVDECSLDGAICGAHGTCYNTYGAHRCRCQSGFQMNGATGQCEDIDECASGVRLCIGKCVNSPGSYRCDCPPGFRLDASGRVCEDIDECKSPSASCHGDESCLNMVGEYKCYRIECPAGYYKDDKRPNRCNKRTIKQIYDQQTRKVTFDSDNQPHYISYSHLTFACNVTSGRPFYEFSFDSGSERYDFDLELANVRARQARSGRLLYAPVDRDTFSVGRQGRNGAALYVTKALHGPQDVELHFKVLDSDGNLFYKAIINLYISEYDGVNF
ncbi:Fibulin-1 [Halotydeus destructor]|nr:Fibulin-1 [Halotydeus destructor]